MENSHCRRQRIYLQQRILRHCVFCHVALLHLFCLPHSFLAPRWLKSPIHHFWLQTAKSSACHITTVASFSSSQPLPNLRSLPYGLIHPLPVIPSITNFIR